MGILDALLVTGFTLVCHFFGPACADVMPQELEVVLPPVRQTGIASYYGSGSAKEEGMHGRITASGEEFDPEGQTCASRTIPLGKIVIVEDVVTGNWTWCRVNDRGPYGARLKDGGWGAMFWRDGKYIVKRRKNGRWTPEEVYDEKPGRYRGIMDLSFGTAKSLDFDFHKGLNRIRVRYYHRNVKHLPLHVRLLTRQ